MAGDLLWGLKFVKEEILLTSFVTFLHDNLGELSSSLSSSSNSRGNIFLFIILQIFGSQCCVCCFGWGGGEGLFGRERSGKVCMYVNKKGLCCAVNVISA